MRRYGIGAGWGALVVVVVGCGSASSSPDASVADADRDAHLEVDGGAVSRSCLGGCDDGDPCTRNQCDDGVCRFPPIAGCTSCATNADCDDGDVATYDECRVDLLGNGRCVSDRRPCVRGCDDFEACTFEHCGDDGFCVYEAIEDCEGCRTDAECDDGDPTTADRCNSLTRACGHIAENACVGFEPCDDGDPCTIDSCNSLGECVQGPSYSCCHYDADCRDANECTTDERCVDHVCQRTEIPGCDCRDFDGDGHGDLSCGGDDCDDFDPSVNPGAAEVCDGSRSVDADCDGAVYGADPDCRTGASTTCEAATAIALDEDVSTTGVGTDDLTGCAGAGGFFLVELAEPSDVAVTVTVDETEHAPDTRYQYAARLRSACGATENLFERDTCAFWDPEGGFVPGAPSWRYDALRLPAGTYVLEVGGGREFDGTTLVDLSVRVEVTPTVTPDCAGAPVLTPGTVTGTTAAAPDAFRATCRGDVRESGERLYRVVATERARWRITARGTSDPVRPARLALYDGCDPAETPRACAEAGSGSCQPERTLDVILDPGERVLRVEDALGAVSLEYALDVHTEPVGASCEGAPVLTGTGSVSGDTTGGPDAFRFPDVCGDGAGPDAVVRLDLATAGRTVIDLVASFGGARIGIREACGGPILEHDTTRIDRELAAGTYFVVVDGATASDAGSWTVNVTRP